MIHCTLCTLVWQMFIIIKMLWWGDFFPSIFDFLSPIKWKKGFCGKFKLVTLAALFSLESSKESYIYYIGTVESVLQHQVWPIRPASFRFVAMSWYGLTYWSRLALSTWTPLSSGVCFQCAICASGHKSTLAHTAHFSPTDWHTSGHGVFAFSKFPPA